MEPKVHNDLLYFERRNHLVDLHPVEKL